MDNLTHNSSSSSSWDLDMSLGSHHHPLLFDSHHPAASAPPPPPPLPFHLSSSSSHPPLHLAHHHHQQDPSPSSSLFPAPHHHRLHHLGLDIDPSQSHHHHHRQSYEQQHQQQEHHHHDDQEEQLRGQQQEEERGGGGAGAGLEEVEEELGAMKEMMYRIAAMQPVDIDPATIKKPRRRNVRISDDPQSVAARHRRERISERIRILQRLVPGGTKMDTASMLDEAIRYIKFLKRQVQDLQHQPPPPPFPGAAAAAGVASGSGVPVPPGRPGGPFLPLGPGPLIDWAGLIRPVDIHGPTSSSSSSSMGGAHAALGFGFSSAGQSSHGGMH